MDSAADAQDRSTRLGELLEEFRALRESDPRVGIGVLREQAGDLFGELQDLVDCEELMRIATEEEEAPPERFGPYRILRVIGAGAAGVVYEAEHMETGQRVALKVMRESLSGEIGVVQRFTQESRTASGLDHPNIVKVFEAGELEGRMFIAMELLEGRSLASVLGRLRTTGDGQPSAEWLDVLDAEGVPPMEGESEDAAQAYAARIAALFAPLAGALGSLADAQLVHRDIKPQNLVLDGEGRLKLTDFGLAKVFGNDLTSSVAVLGTPAYMSPEQAKGRSRDVDSRTDIYGLGATLHEALTLRPPVEADTHGEAIAAVLNERPPSVSTVCPGYPSRLTVLVGRCLEKEPRDRYQDPRELATDLERLAAGLRPAVRAVGPVRRVRRFAAAHPRASLFTAGVGLSVAVLLIFLFTRAAEITLRSHPAGDFVVDGESKGKLPWKGEVSPGAHALQITHARFKPYEDRVELDAGQKWSDTIVLVPKEEDDADAMDLILASMGSQATFPRGDPARGRSLPVDVKAPWDHRVHIIGARGEVTREAVELLVHVEGRVDGLVVKLQAAVGKDTGGLLTKRLQTTVHATTLTADGGVVRIAPPAAALARLETGRRCRWVVSHPDDSSWRMHADFRVTEGRTLNARLESLGAGERAPPHVVLLAAAEFLKEGRAFEAFATVRELATGEQPNRGAVRLALEALAQLGLVDNPQYTELYRKYEAGR